VKFVINLIVLLSFTLPSLSTRAKENPPVSVDSPFVEMHTGPGRGYPIFHVIERDEVVEVLKRRTDWFKVETKDGKQGWIARQQMEQTLNRSGEPLVLPEPDFGDYASRRWELGVSGGEFDSANALSVIGGLHMTSNLSAELSVTQITGSFSDSKLFAINVVHQLFPEWRATPYFTLGAGVIRTEPSATIVATEDRTNNTLQAGLGLRMYITRRFLARLEYRSNMILTSRDENEEAKEWKIGFSVFF
jgi:opacity protein-like surface antigen